MILFGLLLLVNAAWACTVSSVEVKSTKKGSKNVLYTARTMELNLDLPYYLATTPAKTHFAGDFPYCAESTSFDTDYNFLSINMDYDCTTPDAERKIECMFGPLDGKSSIWAFDGMNEKGLSVSALAFTHSKYSPESTYASAGTKICYPNFVYWALGKFATIHELELAMKKNDFVMMDHDDKHFGLQFHWSVQDSTGRDVVIEYNYHNPGRATFYENGVGVMTNNPDFEWHMMNLNNYVNVNGDDPEWWKENDLHGTNTVWQQGEGLMKVPQALGTGANMLGTPGDITPPGRFVRVWLTKQIATKHAPPVLQDNLPRSALTHAENIIQSVWIARGLEPQIIVPKAPNAKEPEAKHARFELNGYTQWTVIKVPKLMKFYYKGYADHRLKMIDMAKLKPLDYTSGKKIYLIDFDNYVMDETNEFKMVKTKFGGSLVKKKSKSDGEMAEALMKILIAATE